MPVPADLHDPHALPLRSGLDATVQVPGSKSITNRALLLAALADGPGRLTGALTAEDRDVMSEGLRRLGVPVRDQGPVVEVEGRGGRVPASEASLDLRLSGTAIRFLTAFCTLGEGRYRLDGNDRMRERPIGDLLQALRDLGAEVDAESTGDCPPVTVHGRGLAGGTARVAGDRSSQFLSALLMVAPYARQPVRLEVQGTLLSRPFVDMTIRLMERYGVSVRREGYRSFTVPQRRYRPLQLAVEPDAMAAGYFWAAAAAAGGRVRTPGLGLTTVQGDARLREVLTELGCRVAIDEHGTEVTGPADGRLRGGTFDLNDMPDQAQTLAVLGLFADAPLRITNVWNLRIKETDRLTAMATELTRIGARVVQEEDAIEVWPLAASDAKPAEIRTYGDHRMAMAFAVAGLRLPGLAVRDPGCVAKTYTDFWRDWASL